MGRGRQPLESPARAVVDLAAIRANYAEASRRAEGRKPIAVVKADAYGHGAVPVARALAEAGCPQLAVVTLAEGCELRAAGIELPLLVLGGVAEGPERAVAERLTPVIDGAAELAVLARAARAANTRVAVHVEVDTGMRRMGVPAAEAEELLAQVCAEPALELEGVYTHFARADEPDLGPTLEQLRSFQRVLAGARARGVAPRLVHCANSAGLLAGKPVFDALPEANAVRPGLMLYGVRPAPHQPGELRPAMTLRARVAAVRTLAAGDAVGYGAAYRAARPTRVATLRVGYADGVPVAASDRGSVWLAGRRHPVVGRVSMDFVGVEIGDTEVAVGDEAILFGEGPEGGLPVEEVAAAAGTISYELLVRVGSRVPRVYEG
jgi:alanine racemase